jgi:pantoate--beta-alanine ligase
MTQPASLLVVRSVAELRAAVRDWKRQGLTVGLVPTMGALHDGHLALVREAVQRADRVVVSNFVNPTQFAPTEDLARYPRQQAEDARLLSGVGCPLMFAPAPEDIYPEGFATSIAVTGPAMGLEGDFRPQMFGGVALVVTKLFNQVQPDLAVFGEKDYQQLLVVRRMARDLALPVRIVAGALVRDEDGVALSSRNKFLSADERRRAQSLHRALFAMRAAAIACVASPNTTELPAAAACRSWT